MTVSNPDVDAALREYLDEAVVRQHSPSAPNLHVPDEAGDDEPLCTTPGAYHTKTLAVYPPGYTEWCQACVARVANGMASSPVPASAIDEPAVMTDGGRRSEDLEAAFASAARHAAWLRARTIGRGHFDPVYPFHRSIRECPFCGDYYRRHGGFADHRDRCEAGPNPGANPATSSEGSS